MQVQYSFVHLVVWNCQGLVPRVPRITGYGSKFSGYDWFPLTTNDSGTIHSVSNMTSPLQAEEDESPT
jgi:hypothetical protein